MDDGSELTWYLGIAVDRRQNGDIELDQNQYLQDKCVQFKEFMRNTRCSTPLPLNFLEEAATSRETDPGFPYKEMAGSLMYAMVGTRPDLAMALSTVYRFMNTKETAL
jgi:hypothetical protein